MRFTLSIDCDSAAFGEDDLSALCEIREILRRTVDRGLVGSRNRAAHETLEGVYFDANGNCVGGWTLSPRDGSKHPDERIREAAPALLAALKAMMDDFGPDYRGPTIDAARAAIAKAEGGAAMTAYWCAVRYITPAGNAGEWHGEVEAVDMRAALHEAIRRCRRTRRVGKIVAGDCRPCDWAQA